MLKCKKCNEEVEDQFEVCWNCGSVELDSISQEKSTVYEKETTNQPIEISENEKKPISIRILSFVFVAIQIISLFLISGNSELEIIGIFGSIVSFIFLWNYKRLGVYLFAASFVLIEIGSFRDTTRHWLSLLIVIVIYALVVLPKWKQLKK
jgi:hypothetical protein